MRRSTFHRRATVPTILIGVFLTAAGCDTTPRTRPMDQPLDAGAAMQADERMRESAGELLDEYASEAPRRDK